MPDLPVSERKPLIRLLRHLLTHGACELSKDGEKQEIELVGQSASCRCSRALLAKALSLGLIQRNGSSVAATSGARTFLRRAALEEDGFQDQHRETVVETRVEDGARMTVRRNLRESPLAVLARLKDRQGAAFFAETQIDAGNRLLADFTRGQLQPRVTASWELRLSSRPKGGAGSTAELADSTISARLRFSRAVEAMGPDLSGVAIDVCCFEKGLEAVERERQWPARSAKLMLRTALSILARHYVPPAAKPRARHWGADGFRPQLDRS